MLKYHDDITKAQGIFLEYETLKMKAYKSLQTELLQHHINFHHKQLSF